MRNGKQLKMLLTGVMVLALLTALLFFVRKKAAAYEAGQKEVSFLHDLTVADIAGFSVTKADGTEVAFSKTEEGWTDATEAAGTYEPDQNMVGAACASLTGVKLIQRIGEPGDLAEYGLLEPRYEIRMSLKDGTERRISVGDSNEAAGVVYVLLDSDQSEVCAVSPTILTHLAYGRADYEKAAADAS